MDVLLETEEPTDEAVSAAPTPFKERSASHKALTAQLGLDTPLPPPKEWRDSSYFASRPEVPSKRTSTASSQRSVSPVNSPYRTPQKPASAILPSPNASVPSSGSSQRSAFQFRAPSDVDSLASPPLSPDDSFRKTSPRGPKPLLLCQGLEPVSPSKSIANPPPLGFSESGDAAMVKQKYSLLRRSVAFVTGSNGLSRKPSVLDRRPSLAQKSLTLVIGGQRSSSVGEKLFDEEETLAPPRHKGFEKVDTGSPQLSQLASPRGDAAEWDADGAAAQFWRRFELAQKRAEQDEKSSRSLRQRLETQRRAHLWSIGTAAVLMVTALIAIIVWRTKLNDANTQPGAAEQGTFAGTTRARRRNLNSTGTRIPASQLKQRLVVRDQLWTDARVRLRTTAPKFAATQLKRRLIVRDQQSRTAAPGPAAAAAEKYSAVDVLFVQSPAEMGAYDHQDPQAHRRLTKRHSQMRRRLSE